ncbi:serine protease [Fructobacillus sp. W13]|uniref:Serine protease n=1 Tax=Fructobacillus apis TaxID=2935017 RepID=A0ABT0ZR45_9LACO|nr:serine protease [Fructobacillus apis]
MAGPEAVRYPYGHQYRGQSVSVRADYFDQALRPEGDAGDNDLALIRLNMPVFGADVLPLAEFRPQDVNREVVSAVGFPSSLGYGHNGGPGNDNDNMYVDYGTIEAMTNRQLLTQNVDWTNGQSGGPILNSQNQVVGIISASNEYGNFATRIDADLNCWIQQQLTNHDEELAPSSARGRWRQLGNRRVYFDADGVAVRITTQRDGNDGEEPLDLSIPKNKNHTHDEL